MIIFCDYEKYEGGSVQPVSCDLSGLRLQSVQLSFLISIWIYLVALSSGDRSGSSTSSAIMRDYICLSTDGLLAPH